ncbi:unnamed protein product [Camellia sinensis]
MKSETFEQRMDSQTPTDAYFTNLLQGGSNLLGEFMMKSPNQMGQCSSQHGEVAGQESPLSPQIESTTKKSQRGGNFSTEEDNLLVSAWLNTSLDAIHGNEQKHKTYWNRVWEYFHKYKTFTSERNQNSLMNRWSTIQLGTNKFCGFFAQIESMHQSGVNEQDKIGKAKLMYQEFQKASFPFEHCWNVLRYQPKWLEECEKKKPKKKKTSATSSPFAPEAINLADDDVSHDAYVDLERPLGRKAEKERLNKRKSKDSAGSNYAGILNGIMEDKKKANDKKMEILEKACLQEQEQNRINQELEQERIRIMKEEIQERFRIKQEKIRAEQLKEEERIIMMDTNDQCWIDFVEQDFDITAVLWHSGCSAVALCSVGWEHGHNSSWEHTSAAAAGVRVLPAAGSIHQLQLLAAYFGCGWMLQFLLGG